MREDRRHAGGTAWRPKWRVGWCASKAETVELGYWPLPEIRRKGLPLVLRQHDPQQLDLGLLVSRALRENKFLFKATQFVVHLLWQPSKTIAARKVPGTTNNQGWMRGRETNRC